jgi:nucleoside-diphosphate-sugar epimerase
MRILLTTHRGYIGAVAAPVLVTAGHDVVGLDADLFAAATSDRPVQRFLTSARICVT